MQKPITIEKNTPISDLIRKFQQEEISRLLVTESKSIVTEKDVGLFLLKDKSERTLGQVPISEVLRPLISIEKNTTIKECSKKMIENEIGSLAVEEEGHLVGIITKTDLVRYFKENFSGKKIVGEYTTWYYAWTYSDTPLFKVVQKMIDERISRVILRNHNEVPEGILTFRDLFRISMQASQDTVVDNKDPLISVVFTKKGFLSESGFGGSTLARDIMSKKIVAVNYNDDLSTACETLLENKINAVGVLSSNDNIIGILSKTDITRALAFLN